MNLPPHDLADHPGDELLSAHLDDAVECDERNALEEHLAACRRCTERREALGGHAAALSVEPLDAVTRRRLVSKALGAADAAVVTSRGRTAGWWRSPRLAAAAAVTLLTAIGLTAALSGGGGDHDASTSAAAGVPESAFVGDVGRLDDPGALRSFLRDQGLGGAAALRGGGGAGSGGSITESDDAAGPESGEGDGGDGATGAAPQPQEDAAPTAATPERLVRDAGPEARADAERCLAVLGDAIPEGARVALAATGTFDGRAAVALVLDSGAGRFLAFVTARDDCSILTFQSFTG